MFDSSFSLASLIQSDEDSESNYFYWSTTTPVQATTICHLLQNPLHAATSTKIRNISHETYFFTTIQYLSMNLK